ncbi:hypothetical protein ACLB2K_022310 [Fragaria x ananassa]
MLDNGVGGCGGLPDMSEVFVLGPGYGSSEGRTSMVLEGGKMFNPNPNVGRVEVRSWFFIPSVLATNLIAHLNKFWAPLGGTSSVLVAVVVPRVKGSNVSNMLPETNVEMVMHNAISRVKRIAGLEGIALAHQSGVLLVSLSKKRKIDRPMSSKNKQKLEDVRPWKLEVFNKGLKKAKRSFGIQRKLTLIEGKASGMEPVLEEVSGSVDGLAKEEARHE